MLADARADGCQQQHIALTFHTPPRTLSCHCPMLLHSRWSGCGPSPAARCPPLLHLQSSLRSLSLAPVPTRLLPQRLRPAALGRYSPSCPCPWPPAPSCPAPAAAPAAAPLPQRVAAGHRTGCAPPPSCAGASWAAGAWPPVGRGSAPPHTRWPDVQDAEGGAKEHVGGRARTCESMGRGATAQGDTLMGCCTTPKCPQARPTSARSVKWSRLRK